MSRNLTQLKIVTHSDSEGVLPTLLCKMLESHQCAAYMHAFTAHHSLVLHMRLIANLGEQAIYGSLHVLQAANKTLEQQMKPRNTSHVRKHRQLYHENLPHITAQAQASSKCLFAHKPQTLTEIPFSSSHHN